MRGRHAMTSITLLVLPLVELTAQIDEYDLVSELLR